MAVPRAQLEAPPLTYEEYLAEGEVMARYDILDGVRIVTNPTRYHQEILLNLAELFRAFQRESGRGRTLIAPCDVLIRHAPLRIRQPELLFISHERLARNAPETDPAPLETAPELVVEILSPSEGKAARRDKLADYAAVGVEECWLVDPADASITVLRLTPAGTQEIAAYRGEEEARSAVFPGLRVPVKAVFAA